MTTVRVEARFNGPPGTGNGGYSAGVMAAAIGESVKVRLLRPVPLDVDLNVNEVEANRWEITHGAEAIAAAMLTRVEAEPPAPVAYIEALGAAKHYAGFAQHAYPQCFVCGPARRAGDGLRIFPGSIPGANIVAAPWLPDGSLDSGDGKVKPEFIWAALDCPGYFASVHPATALLGELAVHIDRPVHIDEPCVVIGWRIRLDGRKHFVGTALFDEDGQRCAIGLATWLELQKASGE